MKTYLITLEVDELWLKAIEQFTNVDLLSDEEVLRWVELKEVK